MNSRIFITAKPCISSIPIGIAYHQHEVLYIIIAKPRYTQRVMIYSPEGADDIRRTTCVDDIPLRSNGASQWIKNPSIFVDGFLRSDYKKDIFAFSVCGVELSHHYHAKGVYITNSARNCISPTRSVVYHHCEAKYTLARDDIQPRRG